MKSLKLFTPFVFLFFVACGGNESAEMAEHADAEHEMMEEMPYDGPNADLIAELDESTELLLSSIDALTPEQWVYQESPDRWSIAGVTEHLVKSEGVFRGLLVDSVLSSEPSMEMPDSTMEADEAVRNMMADRTNPIQTIPPLEPTGIYATPEEAAAAFEAARDETVEFLKTTDKDLRAYSRSLHEGMAPMDGAQWMIFCANHVKRHVDQIEQVKAHEGYPAAAM